QLGIADDAALRTAERDAGERALPRHPHRERLDLVERDVRVVADPSLRWTARNVVRDAVALEDLSLPVVHRNGNGNRQRLLAFLEDVDEVRVNREDLGDPAQLLARDLEGILAQVRDGGVDGRHFNSFFRANGDILGWAGAQPT